MTLVYSGTPRTYPEQGGGGALLAAVRFSAPVRLASVRVVPAGVVFPGGVGTTTPEPFPADVYLNVSPSEPVNALARASLQVEPGPHSVDYALDMPAGTSTRLVVVRLHPPGRELTLSLYAVSESGGAAVAEPAPAPELATSEPTPLPLPSTEGLLSALRAPSPRALATAEVAARTPSLPLSAVLARADVLAALAAAEAADAAVTSLLGLESHPTPREALAALGQLDTPDAAAPLGAVLALAELQSGSTHPRAGYALATVLARLSSLLGNSSTSPPVAAAIAAALPRLSAHAAARGADVVLPTTLDPRRTVASLLPLLADTAATGESTAPAAARLAAPFASRLDATDPLRLAWAGSSASPALAAPSSDAARLARALDDPGATTSVRFAPSAPDLVALLAPVYAATLAHARAPPLGIPSALPHVVATGGAASASDYAGKVYSAHEFRRERETVSGLGVGASGVGRKASRHVDEFGR